MTKPITCLFLGSGASYALAGIPIQRDFLCSLLTEERCQWIDGCGIPDSDRLKIAGSPLSAWMLDVGDIELCMSYLHSVAWANSNNSSLTTPKVEHARRAIVNMRAAIADFLRNKNHQPKPEMGEKFKEWITKLNGKNGSLVILTTNYDLVIENLLGENHYYPEIEEDTGKIRIYKLHGSINWLEKRWFAAEKLNSNKDLGQDRKVDYRPKDLSELHVSCNDQEWAYLFSGKLYQINGVDYTTYNPILVPFLYQKDDWLGDDGGWNKIFPPHWDDAEKFLLENELKQIYFLGYSLPPADYHMMSWLLKILEKHNPKITIVCKGHNGLLERALGPFQPRVCRCGLEGFLEDHV